MNQKLNELKDFLLVVLLFAFRVLVVWAEGFLNEAYAVVSKLDILVNNEIAEVEADETQAPTVEPTVAPATNSDLQSK